MNKTASSTSFKLEIESQFGPTASWDTVFKQYGNTNVKYIAQLFINHQITKLLLHNKVH